LQRSDHLALTRKREDGFYWGVHLGRKKPAEADFASHQQGALVYRMRQPKNADLSALRLKRFGGKVESFCDERNTKHLDVVISAADDHKSRAPTANVAR
jgi:hypothetical protein